MTHPIAHSIYLMLMNTITVKGEFNYCRWLGRTYSIKVEVNETHKLTYFQIKELWKSLNFFDSDSTRLLQRKVIEVRFLIWKEQALRFFQCSRAGAPPITPPITYYPTYYLLPHLPIGKLTKFVNYSISIYFKAKHKITFWYLSLVL